MAKVVITIEDSEEGIKLSAVSDPDFRDVVVPPGKEPWDAYTVGQKASLFAVDKVKEAMGESGFDVKDTPEYETQQPPDYHESEKDPDPEPNQCPSGHEYAADCDVFDDCDDCPVYGKCRAEEDTNEG